MRPRGGPLALAALGAALACSDPPPAPPPPAEPSDVEVLREHLQKEPGDAAGWFHLSELYDRASLYQDEADALRRVVALDPGMGYAHFRLGTTYGRLGDHPAAVKSFLEAQRTFRDQPVLYNNLAYSYGKLGRTGEEIAALRKAIALRPRYATARFNLGKALLARGDRAGAEQQVRALAEFDEGAAASLQRELDARGRAR